MDIKVRLQRVLQVLESAESVATLTDIERDIVLDDLREAYAELKFGATECAQTPAAEVAPVVEEPEEKPDEKPVALSVDEPTEEAEECNEEPEVEVEIIFDESEEEAESEEVAEEPLVETPNAPNAPVTPAIDEMPLPAAPKHNPLLSLYDEVEPQEVVGDTFHEKPSVGDTITCPKGVAESAPVASLREAIGVADRFMLVRELFGGDVEAFERTIDNLDQIGSFDDCMIYIAENYEWRAQSEGAKLVVELLQRKFN